MSLRNYWSFSLVNSPSLILESMENSLAWLISCGLIRVLTHLSYLFSRSFISSCWVIRCFSYLLKYLAQTSLILLSLSLYFSCNVSLCAYALEVIVLTKSLRSRSTSLRWSRIDLSLDSIYYFNARFFSLISLWQCSMSLLQFFEIVSS